MALSLCYLVVTSWLTRRFVTARYQVPFIKMAFSRVQVGTTHLSQYRIQFTVEISARITDSNRLLRVPLWNALLARAANFPTFIEWPLLRPGIKIYKVLLPNGKKKNYANSKSRTGDPPIKRLFYFTIMKVSSQYRFILSFL